MVVATNVYLSAASGRGIYFGVPDPTPDWPVPAPGHHRRIGTSTLNAVKPAGWPSDPLVAGPMANWSSAAFAPDFGDLGAIIYHGSGHLSTDTPLWAGSWPLDLKSGIYVGRNLPPQPLLEGPYYNAFAESTDPDTLGHAYPQHTYGGLIVQPASMGGGTVGKLIRVSAAGQNFTHRWDLSEVNGIPERLFDDQPGTNGYPMTALDKIRNGFWAKRNNGQSSAAFVALPSLTVTMVAIGYNTYGDNFMLHIPAPWDCLLGFGPSGSGGVNWGYWVCPLEGRSVSSLAASPTGFTDIAGNVTGTAPASRVTGGNWSTLLNTVLAYNGYGDGAIYKLTPPDPEDLTTGEWAWTSETTTAEDGHALSYTTGDGGGTWGKLIEVPLLRCAILTGNADQPPQAIRLTGM